MRAGIAIPHVCYHSQLGSIKTCDTGSIFLLMRWSRVRAPPGSPLFSISWTEDPPRISVTLHLTLHLFCPVMRFGSMFSLSVDLIDLRVCSPRDGAQLISVAEPSRSARRIPVGSDTSQRSVTRSAVSIWGRPGCLNHFAPVTPRASRRVPTLVARHRARPQSLRPRDSKSLNRSRQLFQEEFATRSSRERSA